MYSKISGNYQKRHVYNFEDEPPEKKLISDGDILIKQLAEKQRNTKVNLHEQLTAQNQFYKATEILSVTSYTSGFVSLKKFSSVLQQLSDVEKLKSCGLSNEEIELLHDCQSGSDVLKDKHKNLNHSILNSKLEQIYTKIKDSHSQDTKEVVNKIRLTTQTTLATKPASVETKLLKFALENEGKNKQILPGPMDQIKEVEKEFVKRLAPVDIKKIRKKARSLARQIEDIGNPTLKSSIKESKVTETLFCNKTKWDLKECQTEETEPKQSKIFTCKPQNYYTIRNGAIVKINSPDLNTRNVNEEQKKLSVDEIKKIPKFENYEKGVISRVLYVKNLANGVQTNDLENVLYNLRNYVESVNIMKGKMRGQAFVEFTDEETAEKALEQFNGTILKNKPMIIQFGRRKDS